MSGNVLSPDRQPTIDECLERIQYLECELFISHANNYLLMKGICATIEFVNAVVPTYPLMKQTKQDLLAKFNAIKDHVKAVCE